MGLAPAARSAGSVRAVLARLQVRGADRHLPVAAGDVEDIGGLAGPGDPPAQPPDQFLALGDRGAEVPGALGEVAVVQVVGLHPVGHQGPEQPLQRLRGVVHPAQQHGLAEQRDAAPVEAPQRAARRLADLLAVIGVDHHPDGGLGGQGLHQLVGDPLGVDHRHPGVEADHLDVLDRVQRRHDRAELGGRDDQRIAAGEDDLPHLLVGPDVVEGRLQLRLAEHALAGADHLAAEAEAAVDRAQVHRLEQQPVRVAVGDPLDRGEGVVADRVGALLRGDQQLGPGGDELSGDRIVDVRDLLLHHPGDAHGVPLRDIANLRQALLVDEAVLQQGLGGPDCAGTITHGSACPVRFHGFNASARINDRLFSMTCSSRRTFRCAFTAR